MPVCTAKRHLQIQQHWPGIAKHMHILTIQSTILAAFVAARYNMHANSVKSPLQIGRFSQSTMGTTHARHPQGTSVSINVAAKVSISAASAHANLCLNGPSTSTISATYAIRIPKSRPTRLNDSAASGNRKNLRGLFSQPLLFLGCTLLHLLYSVYPNFFPHYETLLPFPPKNSPQ